MKSNSFAAVILLFMIQGCWRRVTYGIEINPTIADGPENEMENFELTDEEDQILSALSESKYYEELQKQAGLGVIISKTKPHLPKETVGARRVKKSLFYHDSCTEVSDYELVSSALNDRMKLVDVHRDTWVFVTRCASPADPCRGMSQLGLGSACKQKKGWAKAYVRPIQNGTPENPYRWQWIAVDRSCNCAVSLPGLDFYDME